MCFVDFLEITEEFLNLPNEISEISDSWWEDGVENSVAVSISISMLN